MKRYRMLFTLTLVLVGGPAFAQQTFIIDSVDDQHDAFPGNGVCMTVQGVCTLRAAIDEANATTNSGISDSIYFDDIPIVGGTAVIALQFGGLPPITETVIIDATTAGGEVIIDGGNNFLDCVTLAYGSGGSFIRGLTIGNCGNIALFVTSNYNKIEKNHIGVSRDGVNYANFRGIYVNGTNNVIGGIDNSNTIGFNEYAVTIIGGSENVLQRNYIGTDNDGQNFGNQNEGIRLISTSNAILGGPTVEHGNRIGFNADGGIIISEGVGHTIRNNFIGTNRSGNNLGNGGPGILLDVGTSNTTIGGFKSYGNVIGFNQIGVYVEKAADNKIRGNFIGTNRQQDPLGNIGPGILIASLDESFLSSNNKIGYGPNAVIPPDAPFGNVIANNLGAGISFIQAAGITDFSNNNSIRGNSFFDNAGLGIALSTSGTFNDVDDADSGSNNLQNYPDVNRVDYNGGFGVVAIEYSISSDNTIVNYPITVDAYIADDVSSGEGRTYIATDTYATQGQVKIFDIDATSFAWAPEDRLVLIATDADGNTSEFSPVSDEIGGPGNMALVADVRDKLLLEEPPVPAEATPQAYPNPFNHTTTLRITPGTEQQTRVLMYDSLGRQVRSVFEGWLPASPSNIKIEAGDLPNGIYWLKIETPTSTSTQSIILQR